MKDKSIPIIIAVVVLGAIALGTGFRRVPNTDNRWLADLHFGDRMEQRWESRDWGDRDWSSRDEWDGESLGDADASAGEKPSDEGAVSVTGDRFVVLGLDAERAEVRLVQSAGTLEVRGESGPLMNGRFDVRPDDLEPEVSMRTENGVGRLTVETPDFDPFTRGEFRRNDWDVALTTDKPLELSVETGAGESELRLGELDLTSLRVTSGAGASLISLVGRESLRESVDVNVDGGVGELEIVLPRDVAVRVRVDQGIGEVNTDSGLTRDDGDWVNAAYREGAPAYEIRIQQGIGEVRLRLAD